MYLTVNTSKTFSIGKIRSHPDVLFWDSVLDIVQDDTYLDTTINYNGAFNKAISKQVNQAIRAMFAMSIKARKLQLPSDSQCELFDDLVMPMLLYGSKVRGFQTSVKLKSFTKNSSNTC